MERFFFFFLSTGPKPQLVNQDLNPAVSDFILSSLHKSGCYVSPEGGLTQGNKTNKKR